MSKGEYQRNLRRVDYTKSEIAERLYVTENAVDDRIKKFCSNYGLDKGFFKRDGESGLNFFAPEFTPLLIAVLENEADNPDRKTKKKRTEITTKDVIQYNNAMQKSIMENSDIPRYLRSFIEQLPFFRSSKDITELLDVFVLELEILICNLFGTKGTDIGQALRQVIRMIDIANYNMFYGRELSRYICKNNDDLQEQNEKMLMEDLEGMEQEKLKLVLQNPAIKAVYDKHNGKIHDENIRQPIDDKSLSIDQGTVLMIKALMQQCGANMLKNGDILDLPEYLSDKQYDSWIETLKRNGVADTKVKATEDERKQYLESNREGILAFLEGCKQQGTAECIINGEKWKPTFELIKEGKEVHLQCNGMQTYDICGEFDKGYLEFCTNIKYKEKELENIVSNFLGRIITEYIFDSRKK